LDKNLQMQPQHTYARVERERRFLLAEFPRAAQVVRVRRIIDHYIDGTNLRLREQRDDGGPAVFKLTQKVTAKASGAQQGFITNMYLTADEFRVLMQLPASKLCKTRHSVPPFGIDVFEGGWHGLLLAEAEFDSAEDADSLVLPPFIFREVSDDIRSTGGRLARASREEVRAWLSEYGIALR
jgi:CYTH domain-containing protein